MIEKSNKNSMITISIIFNKIFFTIDLLFTNGFPTASLSHVT